MLADLGTERDTHDTVAWLAGTNPRTGPHGDLDDEQRAALWAAGRAPLWT
jgi:hypothetical protein